MVISTANEGALCNECLAQVRNLLRNKKQHGVASWYLKEIEGADLRHRALCAMRCTASSVRSRV